MGTVGFQCSPTVECGCASLSGSGAQFVTGAPIIPLWNSECCFAVEWRHATLEPWAPSSCCVQFSASALVAAAPNFFCTCGVPCASVVEPPFCAPIPKLDAQQCRKQLRIPTSRFCATAFALRGGFLASFFERERALRSSLSTQSETRIHGQLLHLSCDARMFLLRSNFFAHHTAVPTGSCAYLGGCCCAAAAFALAVCLLPVLLQSFLHTRSNATGMCMQLAGCF